MVLVSYSGREINAKLVYYGPGLSGKTTNLESIYGSIPQTHRGKMVSMMTKTERTLFFDFLPVNLGELSGFKTRFLLYTVPGQVYYNATRKLVLKGVDAVVFVADSKRGKMDENVESLENLKENLREHGLTLGEIPWVMQYNKRDLPDVYDIEELESVLNPDRVPCFEAAAKTGMGVAETFKGISRLLLRKLSRDVGATIVATEPAAAGPAEPTLITDRGAAPASSATAAQSATPIAVPTPTPTATPASTPTPTSTNSAGPAIPLEQSLLAGSEAGAFGASPGTRTAGSDGVRVPAFASSIESSPGRRSEPAPDSGNSAAEPPMTAVPAAGKTERVEGPAAEGAGARGTVPDSVAGSTPEATGATEPEDFEEATHGLSVGERLRRWLTRPVGRPDEAAAPAESDLRERRAEAPQAGAAASREAAPPSTPLLSLLQTPVDPEAAEVAGFSEPERAVEDAWAADAAAVSPAEPVMSTAPEPLSPSAPITPVIPAALAPDEPWAALRMESPAPAAEPRPLVMAVPPPAVEAAAPLTALRPAVTRLKKRPREIIVPLTLDQADLENGIVLRIAVQMAAETGEDEGELEAAA